MRNELFRVIGRFGIFLEREAESLAHQSSFNLKFRLISTLPNHPPLPFTVLTHIPPTVTDLNIRIDEGKKKKKIKGKKTPNEKRGRNE